MSSTNSAVAEKNRSLQLENEMAKTIAFFGDEKHRRLLGEVVANSAEDYDESDIVAMFKKNAEEDAIRRARLKAEEGI